jgi:TonB family protein
MTDYRNNSVELEQKQFLFLSSALLHACIILCFLLLEQPNKLPSFMRNSETVDVDTATATQQAQNPHTPAQLTGSSGNFGAPVSFVEEEKTQTEQEENIAKPAHDESVQTTAAMQEQKAKAEIKQETTESSLDDAIMATMQTTQPKQEKQQKIGSGNAKPVARNNQQHTKIVKKRGAVPKTIVQIDEKKFTFADLAQGFLQTMHNINRQGNAAISQSGDPNKKPDEMDLKYNSYMAKFNWYLQSSSRLYPFRPNPPITQNLVITIYITIDKDGQLKQCDVVQSSGRSDVDKHIEKIIRKAAPFPDIPDHFGSTIFSFPMTIGIAASPANIDGGYIFVCQ